METSRRDLVRARAAEVARGRHAERAQRAAVRDLGYVDRQTVVRVAAVQAEGIAQAEKVRELDYLAEVAMLGQALVVRYRDVVAGADPLLQDELRFITDMARLGKGEIIADTIAALRRI